MIEIAPKYKPYLQDYSHRYEVYMGSAGSGKSYFITQKLLLRAVQEQIKILVCRRTGTTIRNTCFSLFKDVLKTFNLKPSMYTIRESDFTITLHVNGHVSEILFTGLDEETKLLSLNNIGTIFVEEAYEITKDVFEQLDLRLRAKDVLNQQLIIAFNPISKASWLYDFCSNLPDNALYVHSTYLDNPHLSKEYVKSLEDLKTRNPQKARVFCYGEWGTNSDLLVFHNWRVLEFNPLEMAGKLEPRTGLDFGYVDPTALVCSLYDRPAGKIYVYAEWFKQGAQLDEVYQAILHNRQNRVKIVCDSAEPRSIEYLRNKGVNASPCLKGQNSVNARISFLQNNEILVHPACTSLIAELENFSYLKDRQGNVTENTTHEWSHGIDALGYCYSDLYKSTRLRTLDKSVLGL